jgi:predicted metalloprotease with PDZ domain
MWRERAYRRVYWTGAAFFLRVDVRLRTESGGRHSLDSSLAAFHRCCLHADRRWSARELVEALGRVSIAEIWRQEYFRTIDREAVPRTAGALERLGIVDAPAGARFDQRPAARSLRAAIAGPRTGAAQSLAP